MLMFYDSLCFETGLHVFVVFVYLYFFWASYLLYFTGVFIDFLPHGLFGCIHGLCFICTPLLLLLLLLFFFFPLCISFPCVL